MSGPAWATFGLLAINALSFAAMSWDKFQATRGGRRVPELWLHTLELLGGWPASLVAMQVMRHKRRKPAFWALTLAIAGLWMALAGLWLRQR